MRYTIKKIEIRRWETVHILKKIVHSISAHIRWTMQGWRLRSLMLKKQAETLFRLICVREKILFRLKKQAEKYGL
jgi:hypothetical protein